MACREGITSEGRVYGCVQEYRDGHCCQATNPTLPSSLGDVGPRRMWVTPRLGRNSSPSLDPRLVGRIPPLSADYLSLVIWSSLQNQDALCLQLAPPLFSLPQKRIFLWILPFLPQVASASASDSEPWRTGPSKIKSMYIY